MSTATVRTGRSQVYPFVFSLLLIMIAALPLAADEFNILLLNQTPSEKLEQRPVGRVLIDGGCMEGIEPGLRGLIKSSRDTVTVAALTVTDVNAHEAMCTFETTVDRYMMTRNHLIYLTPAELDPATLFARGMETFDSGDFESACYYYNRVLEAAPDNDLARTRVESCRRTIESRKSQPLTEEEKRAEADHIPVYLEIAQAYRKLKNYTRAREYINRVLAVDEKHPRARTLQRLIPSESTLAAARQTLPKIDEFVPVDQPPELIEEAKPTYPKVAKDAGLEGTVWIKALIDRKGDVVDAVVYKSCGFNILDQSALRVAKQNKFKPAMQDGHPVATWVPYNVVFER